MPDPNRLEKFCKLVRYDILRATTEAGSGHPTSSLSAVELAVTLFFGGFLRQNIRNPQSVNDKFILSKGHASPLLYALYHVGGVISDEELMNYRKFGSPLEGHPTPQAKFVGVATGSLGQGLSVGLGMALGMKLATRNSQLATPKVYVLLGDSEMAEGQVFEAMELASYYKLDNLIAIVDVNRLGQRGQTMLGWDIETYKKRAEAFGWNVITIDDGHDLEEVYRAFELAVSSLGPPQRADGVSDSSTGGKERGTVANSNPTIIFAKTIKGKGVSFLEDQDDWHGKVLDKERLEQALKELGDVDLKLREDTNFFSNWEARPADRRDGREPTLEKKLMSGNYKLGDLIATREAYGDALVELGKANPAIVALDGEVSNSTFSNTFQKALPDRFFEMFIAEQNMVSAALGLSKVGFVPFVSTFAAFLTRAFDQIRMAQYSMPRMNLVGSHAGVSIGADGPSQMGLEDLAMMRSVSNSVVLYPADATSAFRLTEIMGQNEGLFYLRTTREKTPVIYDKNEEFKVGGSKIHSLKTLNSKPQILIIAAGITLHEALKAQEILAEENIETTVIDCYSVKPLDQETIQKFSHLPIIVAEDHYPAGGLGESVLSALISNYSNQISSSKSHLDQLGQLGIRNFVHLCVRKIPRSGKLEELLHYEEIDSNAIVSATKQTLNPKSQTLNRV